MDYKQEIFPEMENIWHYSILVVQHQKYDNHFGDDCFLLCKLGRISFRQQYSIVRQIDKIAKGCTTQLCCILHRVTFTPISHDLKVKQWRRGDLL